jgi:two-component sensor histidine kinase
MAFTAIVRDISQRVAAEELMLISLREKEVLLKEIHHRVKNNLQVVASLLGLQARAASNETMRKMLQDSQDRIHSMALLHENLYQSEDLSTIDFPEYVRQLAGDLFRAYGISRTRVRLDAELEPLPLDLDGAVACGLIINELVSNALKHAFPDQRDGIIKIEVREIPDRHIHLIVSDNGIGAGDWQSSPTLGLRLIRTLTEQLGGDVEFATMKGTRVQVTFPLSKFK